MNKKITALGVTLGLVVLLGAGCANPTIEPGTNDNNPNTTVPAADQTTPTATTDQTTTEQTTPTETATTFTVTANATGDGKVNVEWTAPADLDRTSSFRVLNSSKSKADLSFAYWDQFMNVTRSAELKNVHTGHRYIRVCEYKNETCVNFSNEVEVDVQ